MNLLDILLLLVPLEIVMVFWIFRWARHLMTDISKSMKTEIGATVNQVEEIVKGRVMEILTDPMLFDKLVAIALTKREYQKENGDTVSRAPVDFLIDRFIQNFNMSLKGHASGLKRAMNGVEQEFLETGTAQDRLLAIMKKRIPKEYAEDLELLAQTLGKPSGEGQQSLTKSPFD